MSQDDLFLANRSPNPLEETIERVTGAIKSRLLSPGDRLPAERELAAQLGVSRSTLRVALQSLVDDGWLEVRRGRSGGSFVARWPRMPSPRKLPEVLSRYRNELPPLLDYRRAVESAAAAFAAERATAEEIAELELLSKAVDTQPFDFEAYRTADARFHIGLARAAHSTRIMQAVTEVQAAITEVLDVIVYHTRDQLAPALAHHEQILDAIHRHNSEEARYRMIDHVMATERVIYAYILPQEGEATGNRGLGTGKT